MIESQVAQAHQMTGEEASSSTALNDVWRKIWKLQVVPKVDVFWWRVVKGILPKHRHIEEDSVRKLCRASDENLLHALVQCSHAQLFWAAMKDILKVKLAGLHPETWRTDILREEVVPKLAAPTIITIMWSIWTSHNR